MKPFKRMSDKGEEQNTIPFPPPLWMPVKVLLSQVKVLLGNRMDSASVRVHRVFNPVKLEEIGQDRRCSSLEHRERGTCKWNRLIEDKLTFAFLQNANFPFSGSRVKDCI